jgi:toxin ParE1/3/4
MISYRFSAHAEADLAGIEQQVSGDNPDAARLLIARFRTVFRQLALHPGLGRFRPDVAPEIRGFPVGSYLVFYLQDEAGILIVRILYGARDLPRAYRETDA